MNVIEWYFGFYPKARIGEIVHGKSSWRSLFGHVEAWGYTEHDTWVFIDPRGAGTRVRVTHMHDDVLDMITVRFELCQTILKMPAADGNIRWPIFPPMNCAGQSAHLVGLRAFSPDGLRRMLLRKGAEIVHATQGRPGSSETAEAPAPHG